MILVEGTVFTTVLLASLVVIVTSLLIVFIQGRTKAVLVEFSTLTGKRGTDVVAVDCTHPFLPNLTHHKGSKTPLHLKADTSGGIVLNAVLQGYKLPPKVSCNHFDADGLVAVFSALSPKVARKHAALLREIARVGDFRARLPRPRAAASVTAPASPPSVHPSCPPPSSLLQELDLDVPHGRAALAFNLWVNSVERELFYRPFHGSDTEGAFRKYSHFLPKVEAALEAAAAGLAEGTVLTEAKREFDFEHDQVLRGLALINGPMASVSRSPDLGLVVVALPQPVHYYALFSVSRDLDSVLTLYPGNRYEFELKYTGYVELASRPAKPRLDLGPLATALNKLEGPRDDASWQGNSIVDSGPLLRMYKKGEKMSKAQRFGHPFEREYVRSNIPPDTVAAVVRSFLEFGLRGVEPKVGWGWSTIHEINGAIDWARWEHYSGKGSSTGGEAIEGSSS